MSSHTKEKRISVAVEPEEYEAASDLAKQLGTSRGRVGAFALKFAIPMIKAGKMAFVNGELKLVTKAA